MNHSSWRQRFEIDIFVGVVPGAGGGSAAEEREQEAAKGFAEPGAHCEMCGGDGWVGGLGVGGGLKETVLEIQGEV